MDLLIVGNRGGSNIGESFERAARQLRLTCDYLNAKEAMAGPRVLRHISWHLLNRRPVALRRFSVRVQAAALSARPRLLLTTGISPVDAGALARIGEIGTIRCNFLTDDPWSASHRSAWFLNALQQYDFVFTPRRLLRGDLAKQTSARVVDLPFGIDPDLFHPVSLTLEENKKHESDVMFAGGADRDRVPYLAALRDSGLVTALYGDYWERFPETKPITRGTIATGELPKAIAASKVALCLVRRANRDQHCMRTFEVPAVGGCMLTEDTEDHRNLFGPEGQAVLYFSSIPEMLSKARWLIDHEGERRRLANTAHTLIQSGAHNYRSRLETILRDAGQPAGIRPIG